MYKATCSKLKRKGPLRQSQVFTDEIIDGWENKDIMSGLLDVALIFRACDLIVLPIALFLGKTGLGKPPIAANR